MGAGAVSVAVLAGPPSSGSPYTVRGRAGARRLRPERRLASSPPHSGARTTRDPPLRRLTQPGTGPTGGSSDGFLRVEATASGRAISSAGARQVAEPREPAEGVPGYRSADAPRRPKPIRHGSLTDPARTRRRRRRVLSCAHPKQGGPVERAALDQEDLESIGVSAVGDQRRTHRPEAHASVPREIPRRWPASGLRASSSKARSMSARTLSATTSPKACPTCEATRRRPSRARGVRR